MDRKILAIVAFLACFLLLLHHYIMHGRWYDPENIASHEIVEAVCVAFGIGCLIGV